MRVLLTGANGFIGRHVLDALLARGVEVVALGRGRPRNAGAIDFIEADLLATPDYARITDTARATHLLHLAWYVEHGKFWDSPLNEAWRDATAGLVEAFCRGGGKHVVAAGTCYEYRHDDTPCDEESTAIEPATPYGNAKRETQERLRDICESHGVAWAWGRIFLLYGEGEGRRRLVPALADALRGRAAPFGVHRDARRDFMHVADVATAFHALLGEQASGCYNLCSGQATAIETIVREIADVLGTSPDPVLDLAPGGAKGPASLFGRNDRLAGLGWHQALSLREGLEKTLACI
ncbi:NAD-dependent epimerase/dehydratase domain-containing protein [Bordetella sputigena]|uniref:NAD-dependent epimerase/dehydratase family protein n=1 Tax=Bordetella sputigena TaxID=1416810 RepID=UPI0039F05D33